VSSLRIAKGLALDPDYVGGGTFALLAKKGAGKTYTGRVMAEEFWDAKVPFVVLDPMGAWWGLRAAADGGPDGIPVAIFGGDHADAPLERTGGTVMADLVVDEGLSMILDMSALGSRAAERQFAHEFLERLYRRNSELVHVFIDEADLFAPQKPQSGDQQLLGVTENIVRRGRNRGIGITLITQRPAVLNKDVLTQVDGLVAMRIVGLTDREAIDKWVEGHGDTEAAREVKGTLSGLANGECWWWVPELDILSRVQVRQSHTFDSSPTKKRGEKRREPKSFADVDMGAVEQKMAATIERAKAEDPKELRRQIRDLKAELGKRPTEKVTETVTETVEVPVLNDEHIEALRELVESVGEHAGKFIAGANDIAAGLRKATGQQQRVVPPPSVQRPAPAAQAPPRARPEPREPVEPGDLTPSLRKILDALAMLETFGITQPSRVQVAVFVGESHKGGAFNNKVSRLRTMGYLEYPQQGLVTLTEAGHVEADAGQAPSTVDEMHQLARGLVGPARARILDVLIARYPDPITREDLAAEVGEVASGGAFNNKVSRLRSLGLADYPQQGWVAAAPVLFLEAAAA
jgi:uncharacterized protein